MKCSECRLGPIRPNHMAASSDGEERDVADIEIQLVNADPGIEHNQT